MPSDPVPTPAGLAEQILAELTVQANPDNVAGMARFGIAAEGTLGISIPVLRGIAKRVRPVRRSDPAYAHELAAALWASGVHEARILAGFIDVPALVTSEQLEAWVLDFDSWDVCDQVVDLFAQTSLALEKAVAWSKRDETASAVGHRVTRAASPRRLPSISRPSPSLSLGVFAPTPRAAL